MNRCTAKHHVVEHENFNFSGMDPYYQVPAPNFLWIVEKSEKHPFVAQYSV